MNYERAKELNDLPDYDFYEVMSELAKMHDLYNIDDFTDWLKDVLYEIEEIRQNQNEY